MAVNSLLLSSIPHKPGVYLMKDKAGKVLYVGKAKSLKERVRSYFSPPYSPKTKILVSKTDNVDYIVTESEVDALVLEANLIKLHLPHYNIRLKDDKKYPYIKVSMQEDFPSIFPTRDPGGDTFPANDKLEYGKEGTRRAIYFGPYTNVKTMKRALKSATEIFPVRLCRSKLPHRVCLAYHIGRCPGPCENKISQEEYKENVQQLIDFLSGKSQKIEEKLKNRMRFLSDALEFEEAAKVRDRLLSVQSIVRKQRVVFDEPIDMDVFGLQRGSTSRNRNQACIAVTMVREGRIIGNEHYILHIQPKSTGAEIMRAFFLQYYKNASYIPQQIVVPEIEEKEVIEKWLNRPISTPNTEVQPPNSTFKTQNAERRTQDTRRKTQDTQYIEPLLKFATQNAEVWLEAERVERAPKALEELKKQLNLTKIPNRIEAFDISNIGGKYAVGSCVSFVKGKTQKSGYRRFRIKTVDGIDDTAMMNEIITRKYKEKAQFPDLVLVDGGIAQVRVTRECLPKEVPVFGLAKRFEELHLPDGKIISLPKSSLALRLLQKIRNEAHRFAISYHKKLRDHPHSILEEITGIGEKRRKALLKHFASFEALKHASLKEIEKVPGISKANAKQIYIFLRLL